MTYLEYLRDDVFPDRELNIYAISATAGTFVMTMMMALVAGVMASNFYAVLGALIIWGMAFTLVVPTFVTATFVYWLLVRRED